MRQKILFFLVGMLLSITSLPAQDKFDRFVGQLDRLEQTCRRLINTGNELKRLSPVRKYDRQTTQVKFMRSKVRKIVIGDLVVVNKKDRIDVYRQKNGSRNRLALISKLYDSNHIYTADALVDGGGIVSYKIVIIVEDNESALFKLAGNRIAEEYDLEY